MYPILTRYLQETTALDRGGYRRNTDRQRFTKAITAIHAGHDAGSILNKTFTDSKTIINAAIDEVAQTIQERLLPRMNETPPDVSEFIRQVDMICPYINIIPGKLKRAEGVIARRNIDHPYCLALVDLLREIAPLSAIVADLKHKVVKRLLKPVEEQKSGYHPPKVTTEAQATVVALLEGVTKEAYDLLVSAIENGYQAVLARYLMAQEGKSPTESFSPHDYFVRRLSSPNYDDRDLVQKLVLQEGSTPERTVYFARPDADSLITAMAKETADVYRTYFVHKNFRKIASIVEAKGNLLEGKAYDHSVSLSGLTGNFVFRFTDGSQFSVINQVVFVINRTGTRFFRYPLTFTNVRLPGDLPMPRPSEKRMNEVFTKC